MKKLKESQTAWKVMLNGKEIDVVYYDNDMDADEIKQGLVDHDGYDPDIKLIKESKIKEYKSDNPLNEWFERGITDETILRLIKNGGFDKYNNITINDIKKWRKEFNSGGLVKLPESKNKEVLTISETSKLHFADKIIELEKGDKIYRIGKKICVLKEKEEDLFIFDINGKDSNFKGLYTIINKKNKQAFFVKPNGDVVQTVDLIKNGGYKSYINFFKDKMGSQIESKELPDSIKNTLFFKKMMESKLKNKEVLTIIEKSKLVFKDRIIELYSNDKIYFVDKKLCILKEDGEKWSNEVETKVPEKEGILSGSASEIASASKKQHSGDIGKAIQGLTFRKNQAGENMSAEMKKNIEGAIEILQKENKK